MTGMLAKLFVCVLDENYMSDNDNELFIKQIQICFRLNDLINILTILIQSNYWIFIEQHCSISMVQCVK